MVLRVDSDPYIPSLAASLQVTVHRECFSRSLSSATAERVTILSISVTRSSTRRSRANVLNAAPDSFRSELVAMTPSRNPNALMMNLLVAISNFCSCVAETDFAFELPVAKIRFAIP